MIISLHRKHLSSSLQLLIGKIYYTNLFIDSFHILICFACRENQYSEQLALFDTLSFQLYPPEPLAKMLPDMVNYVSDHEQLSTIQSERIAFLRWLYRKGYNIESQLHDYNSLDSQNNRYLSFHIYGVMQSLMKMHPIFDSAIVKLLIRDPLGMIVILRNPKQSSWQIAFQDRLKTMIHLLVKAHFADTLKVENVDDEDVQSLVDGFEKNIFDRIIFVNPLTHKYYAKVICLVDVVLDPFPFGGGVTMCDAIAGGCHHNRSIPFVTSGQLQTVHHIAAGLAQVLNSSWYAVDSDKQVDYSFMNSINNEREVLKDLSRFLDNFVVSYVERAIQTAILSHKEILKKADIENNAESEPEAYFEIYKRSKEVAKEWTLFFQRTVRIHN